MRYAGSVLLLSFCSLGSAYAAPSVCDNVPPEGWCNGSRLEWCEDGELQKLDCPDGLVCAWAPGPGVFDCVGSACGDVPATGQCSDDYGTVEWCDGGKVSSVQCPAGTGCGWHEKLGAFDCLTATVYADKDAESDAGFGTDQEPGGPADANGSTPEADPADPADPADAAGAGTTPPGADAGLGLGNPDAGVPRIHPNAQGDGGSAVAQNTSDSGGCSAGGGTGPPGSPIWMLLAMALWGALRLSRGRRDAAGS